jgi:hypothetical protein
MNLFQTICKKEQILGRMKARIHIMRFWKIFLLASLVVLSFTSSGQWIWQTQQVPNNPTNVDSLKSIVTTLFPFNAPFNTIPMTNYNVNINDNTIDIMLFYDISGCWTGGPEVTLSVDTINWNTTLEAGTYQLYYIMNTFMYNFDTVNPIHDTVFSCSIDSVLLTVSQTSSSEEFLCDDYLNLRILPNPASNYVSLDFHKSISIKEISILDLFGREITHTKYSSNIIDISRLKSSPYLFKIISDRGIVTKLVIVK